MILGRSAGGIRGMRDVLAVWCGACSITCQSIFTGDTRRGWLHMPSPCILLYAEWLWLEQVIDLLRFGHRSGAVSCCGLLAKGNGLHGRQHDRRVFPGVGSAIGKRKVPFSCWACSRYGVTCWPLSANACLGRFGATWNRREYRSVRADDVLGLRPSRGTSATATLLPDVRIRSKKIESASPLNMQILLSGPVGSRPYPKGAVSILGQLGDHPGPHGTQALLVLRQRLIRSGG